MRPCIICPPETTKPYELVARADYSGKKNLGSLQPYGVLQIGGAVWEVYTAPCCGHVIYLRPDLRVHEEPINETSKPEWGTKGTRGEPI